MARRIGGFLRALRGVRGVSGLHKVHCMLHCIAAHSIAEHGMQMFGVPVNAKQMGQFIFFSRGCK